MQYTCSAYSGRMWGRSGSQGADAGVHIASAWIGAADEPEHDGARGGRRRLGLQRALTALEGGRVPGTDVFVRPGVARRPNWNGRWERRCPDGPLHAGDRWDDARQETELHPVPAAGG